MTDRRLYTDDQLEGIADAIWGAGRYDEKISLYQTPCPICGADVEVSVSGLTMEPPPRFRVTCSSCGLYGSGKATSVEMRLLRNEEIDDILELDRRGRQTMCPACTAPLRVEEDPLSGPGIRHFSIRCLRCGTRGQRRLEPSHQQG